MLRGRRVPAERGSGVRREARRQAASSQVSGDPGLWPVLNPSPCVKLVKGHASLTGQNPSVANPFPSVSEKCEGGLGERGMSSSEDLSREP